MRFLTVNGPNDAAVKEVAPSSLGGRVMRGSLSRSAASVDRTRKQSPSSTALRAPASDTRSPARSPRQGRACHCQRERASSR